ncbi:MAG: putative molybdenum carrier protein [Gammaproteobacteria bacterium]|nr:putative molybdenum carrier protein [Gammaproteobacteria bacterium]
MMIEKIVSGGQTGVDRAALDCAIALDIPHGGWCPAGRAAEDGIIPGRYHLVETDSPEYVDRTRKNVEDSDGTLILNRNQLEGGTAATLGFARSCGKPVLVVDLDSPLALDEIRNWLLANKIKQCNVAGPRESKIPGIYRQAYRYLMELLGSE